MMYVGMVFVSVYVTLGMELVGCVHACACDGECICLSWCDVCLHMYM